MANVDPDSDRRGVYVCLVVTGLLIIALLVAGLVTPGWLVINYSEITSGLLDLKVSKGLLYTTYCVKDVCESHGLSGLLGVKAPTVGSLQVFMYQSMNEYKAEAITSVVTMIIFLVCLLKMKYFSLDGIYKCNKAPWIVLCVGPAISASCALTAAVNCGISIIEITETVYTKYDVNPFNVPYSIILEGVGGFLALTRLINIVVETIRAYRINSAYQPQNHAMPTYPAGAQPCEAQPYTAQPYAAQPYAAQPYAGQPYDGQAYNGPLSNSKRYGNQPDNNQYNNPNHSNSGYSDSEKDSPSDYRGQSRRY